MNQPTEDEVAKLLATPKAMVSYKMQWAKKPSGHIPSWWEFTSALTISGETPADLFVRLSWQAPIPGATRPKFSCSMLWHSHRILGVDMEETRHRNPIDIGRPYAGVRLVGYPVHHHQWHNVHSHHYAEPVNVNPDEKSVFAYFATCANMTMSHGFSWPSEEIQQNLFD